MASVFGSHVQPTGVSRAPLIGVFKTLAEQHAQVGKLFERLSAYPEERGALWPQIRLALLSHERGERRELYPVLRASETMRKFADLHEFEAKHISNLIVELDTTEIGSLEWLALFEELAGDVIIHAREEELALFPSAQLALGRPVAEELDAKFLRAHRQLIESA